MNVKSEGRSRQTSTTWCLYLSLISMQFTDIYGHESPHLVLIHTMAESNLQFLRACVVRLFLGRPRDDDVVSSR